MTKHIIKSRLSPLHDWEEIPQPSAEVAQRVIELWVRSLPITEIYYKTATGEEVRYVMEEPCDK